MDFAVAENGNFLPLLLLIKILGSLLNPFAFEFLTTLIFRVQFGVLSPEETVRS
jgi:hypothetical protein